MNIFTPVSSPYPVVYQTVFGVAETARGGSIYREQGGKYQSVCTYLIVRSVFFLLPKPRVKEQRRRFLQSPISTRLSTFPPPLQLHILDGFSTASLDLTDSRLYSLSDSDSNYTLCVCVCERERFPSWPSQKIKSDGQRHRLINFFFPFHPKCAAGYLLNQKLKERHEVLCTCYWRVTGAIKRTIKLYKSHVFKSLLVWNGIMERTELLRGGRKES